VIAAKAVMDSLLKADVEPLAVLSRFRRISMPA